MKFKVQVLFSKDMEIEAADKQEARELAGKEAVKQSFSDKFYIQEPKDLSKPAKEENKKS